MYKGIINIIITFNNWVVLKILLLVTYSPSKSGSRCAVATSALPRFLVPGASICIIIIFIKTVISYDPVNAKGSCNTATKSIVTKQLTAVGSKLELIAVCQI